jgi:hypothetical protein
MFHACIHIGLHVLNHCMILHITVRIKQMFLCSCVLGLYDHLYDNISMSCFNSAIIYQWYTKDFVLNTTIWHACIHVGLMPWYACLAMTTIGYMHCHHYLSVTLTSYITLVIPAAKYNPYHAGQRRNYLRLYQVKMPAGKVAARCYKVSLSSCVPVGVPVRPVPVPWRGASRVTLVIAV